MLHPDLTPSLAALLFSAGLLAGGANAIAGGGTFFSFPMFMAAGLPPVVANASNAVAVWPGHALATIGYRRELLGLKGGLLVASAVAAIGGAVGAWLLARIGNASFLELVPWLLLAATLLFALGPALNRWIRTVEVTSLGIGGQAGIFVFSVYGGFFGAGLGIMLMAGLMILGVQDPQRNNALKNMLATVVTSIGVVVLALTGLVAWPHTACALAGAVAGGVGGTKVARHIPVSWLRAAVISVGLMLSAHYFFKLYGPR